MRQNGPCGYTRVVFKIMTEEGMASCYISNQECDSVAYAAGNSSQIRLNGELEDVLADQRDPQKMESFDYSGPPRDTAMHSPGLDPNVTMLR